MTNNLEYNNPLHIDYSDAQALIHHYIDYYGSRKRLVLIRYIEDTVRLFIRVYDEKDCILSQEEVVLSIEELSRIEWDFGYIRDFNGEWTYFPKLTHSLWRFVK